MFSNNLNHLVLALLTNRTLVWAFDPNFDPELCDQVLHRSNWIAPSTTYQAAQQYSFRQRAELLQACIDVLNVTSVPHQTQYACMDRLAAAPAGTAALLGSSVEDHQVIEFQMVFGCIVMEIPGWQARFDMRVPTCADYVRALFPTELPPQTDDDGDDDNRIDKLYKYGLDYLYGMVFRHAFRMTEALTDSIGTTTAPVDADAFSVAIHTRHPQTRQDGTQVERETACLDRVLAAAGLLHNNNTTSYIDPSSSSRPRKRIKPRAKFTSCRIERFPIKCWWITPKNEAARALPWRTISPTTVPTTTTITLLPPTDNDTNTVPLPERGFGKMPHWPSKPVTAGWPPHGVRPA